VFKRVLIGDHLYKTESEWMGYMVKTFLLATVISLFLSYFIFHFLEKPVQKMLTRGVEKKKGVEKKRRD
jgi:peptidoglycan/LPS O-acetylase OafA/YrhL